jgi:hypothetical protein
MLGRLDGCWAVEMDVGEFGWMFGWMLTFWQQKRDVLVFCCCLQRRLTRNELKQQ